MTSKDQRSSSFRVHSPGYIFDISTMVTVVSPRVPCSSIHVSSWLSVHESTASYFSVHGFSWLPVHESTASYQFFSPRIILIFSLRVHGFILLSPLILLIVSTQSNRSLASQSTDLFNCRFTADGSSLLSGLTSSWVTSIVVLHWF